MLHGEVELLRSSAVETDFRIASPLNVSTLQRRTQNKKPGGK
jgi:hypothetical protein